MRTNIDLDEELIAEAMELGRLATKKAAVDEALREFVRVRRQMRAIDSLEGIGWAGDLGEMRDESSRYADWGFREGE
jgi:Arc/MetJ family transcription regulator